MILFKKCYIMYYIPYYIIRRPVGVWNSKFDSIPLEFLSEAKSESERSESEVKRSVSESTAKSEASRSEAGIKAPETRLGGRRGVPGCP